MVENHVHKTKTSLMKKIINDEKQLFKSTVFLLSKTIVIQYLKIKKFPGSKLIILSLYYFIY